LLQQLLFVLIGIIFEILIAKLISIFSKGCRAKHCIELVVIVVVFTAIPAETYYVISCEVFRKLKLDALKIVDILDK